MNYLLDTNILLESIFKQSNAARADDFLVSVNRTGVTLALSRFSLYSISLIMLRKKMNKELMRFLGDLAGKIAIVDLDTDDLRQLVGIVVPKYGLDFDDGYQYTCAKKYGLELVSFDKDFDKTDIKRLEP